MTSSFSPKSTVSCVDDERANGIAARGPVQFSDSSEPCSGSLLILRKTDVRFAPHDGTKARRHEEARLREAHAPSFSCGGVPPARAQLL